MLTAFRKFGETSVVKYALLLLALSFVTWGIGDYLQGGSNYVAVKVGDKKISVNEVYSAYQIKKNQLAQMTQNTITDEMAQQMGLPNIVLGELVREELIKNAIHELGISASDQNIAESIRSISTFQNDKGEFDKALYLQQLRNSGLSTSTFEKNLKTEQERKIFFSYFQPIIADAWAKRIAEIKNTQFDITVLPVSFSSLPTISAPSAQELEEFYQSHSAQYMTPETRNINYAILSSNDIAQGVKVSDAEIQDYYKGHPESFMTEETRTVMQYVSPSKEEAKKLREDKINGLELKTGVQSLGSVSRIDLPQNISDIVFQLELNDVSKIVETPFGQSFLWVTSISPTQVKPLEDVKSDIIQEIKNQKAEDLFEDYTAELEDKFAAGQLLSQISSELPFLKVKSISNLKRDNETLPAELLQEAFLLPENEVSDAIELEKEDGYSLAFVEVSKIMPSTLPALKVVKVKVLEDYKTQRDEARISKVITDLKALNIKEVPMYLSSQKLNINLEKLSNKNQESLLKAGIRKQAIESLMSSKINSAIPETILYKDAASVVFVNNRIVQKPSTDMVNETKIQMAQNIQNELLQQVLTTLQDSTEVKLYESRLNQAFGVQ